MFDHALLPNIRFDFGTFVFDPNSKTLASDTSEEVLNNKNCQVLLKLLESPEEVIDRQELIDNIWEGNFYVGDKAVTHTIWNLRKSLDNMSSPIQIETKPKKGYRLDGFPKIIFLSKPDSTPLQVYLNSQTYSITSNVGNKNVSEEGAAILRLIAQQEATAIPLSSLQELSQLSRPALVSTLLQIHQKLATDSPRIDLFKEVSGGLVTLNCELLMSDQVADSHDFICCPYRGLEAFRPQHAAYFFGREMECQKILDKLNTSKFLALLGPSGSGKSSLVGAGVQYNSQLTGSNVRVITPAIIPGDLIQSASSESIENWMLRKHKDIQDAVPDLLIIDQFEEVFSYYPDATHQETIITAICHVIEKHHGKSKVLIAMRSDFLGHCAPFAKLNQLISENLLQLAPLSIEQISESIVKPAEMAGLVLEKALLHKVLDDIEDAKNELPLIQHTLMELFNLRVGNKLTLSSYVQLGGIQGALAKRAEKEYTQLNPKQKRLLKSFFILALVASGSDNPNTRRKATRKELYAVAQENTPEVSSLIESWISSRLLSGHHDTHSGEDIVEITHETLIKKWDRLSSWMQENQELTKKLQQLRNLEQVWVNNSYSDDQLLRGEVLQDALHLQGEQGFALGDRLDNFINNSRHFSEAQKQQQQRHESKQKRRKKQLLLSSGFVLFTFIAGLVTFSVQTQRQKQEVAIKAEEAEQVAELLSSIFQETDPNISLDKNLSATELLNTAVKNINSREMPTRVESKLKLTIAEVYVGIGEFQLAEGLLNEILEDETIFGALPEVTKADILDNLAISKINMGSEFDLAKQHIEQSLQIRQAVSGDTDPQIPRSLSLLGSVNIYLGNLDKGLEKCNLALELRQRHTPDQVDLSLLEIHGCLSFANRELNIMDEALHHGKKVASHSRKLLDPDNYILGINLNNLGSMMYDAGKLSDSLPLFQEALTIFSRSLEDDHGSVATTKHNYARSLSNLGRLAEAGPLFQQSREAYINGIGAESYQMSVFLIAYSDYLQKSGDLPTAQSSIEEAKRLLTMFFPADHWRLSVVQNIQGAIMVKIGDESNGLQLMEKSYRHLLDIKGNTSQYTIAARQRLSSARGAANELEAP